MKPYAYISALILLLLHYNSLNANDNYNVSILYLSIPNYHAIEVSLGDRYMKKQGDSFVVEGIEPGRHLLRISQKQHFQASMATNSEYYEVVLYYGYVEIAPKKVIFAKLDESQHLRILKERATKTVATEPLQYRECAFCFLRDS